MTPNSNVSFHTTGIPKGGRHGRRLGAFTNAGACRAQRLERLECVEYAGRLQDRGRLKRRRRPSGLRRTAAPR